MSWKLIRIFPPCDSCTLPDDFEGATDGSSVFPNGVIGAKRTVRLRVRPFLGEFTARKFSIANYVKFTHVI